MSRRDTIIIAVLLNAGLLIVLFATSLKSENVEPSSQSAAALPPAEIAKVEPVTAQAPVTPAAGDEVDRALKQFTPVLPAPEGSQSFAADLQAIGSLEPQQPQTSVAPSAPVLEPEVSYKEVKVKKGDVLERIARHNHVSVDELMKANNLTSTKLKIGQVLKIPAKKKANAVSVSEPSEGKFYVVKPGDNPWTIAVKNHMKVEELLALNNLNEQQAKRLKPGDKLKIK